MRYSQTTELAVDSLFYMAAHSEKSAFSIDEIARAQNVSSSYLAKVFQQLAKAGVLRSHRGARGGYSLGRGPEDITLWDIASVCEGTSPLYGCSAAAKKCGLGPRCLIVKTFNDAGQKMREVLAGVSLQDLLESIEGDEGQPQWVAVGVDEARDVG
jgi:Rrf2 family protein